MKNRRDFLKIFGVTAAAGAFVLAAPQLTNGHTQPEIDRFVPTPELIDRNLLYEFRRVPLEPHIMTANPRTKYRPYLVDLYATDNCGLLSAMVDKSIELAMTQDTRGWNVGRWNDELREAHEIAAANKFEKEIILQWKHDEDF